MCEEREQSEKEERERNDGECQVHSEQENMGEKGLKGR